MKKRGAAVPFSELPASCGIICAVTPAEVQQLKQEYVILAAYYQQKIGDEALVLYAADLEDLDLSATLQAMHRLRRQPGRRSFPLPGDIRDAVAPSEGSAAAKANEIAGKITAAITRFGYTQPERAQAYLGELGWLIINRMGGWRALCNSLLSSEMGTFRAQARDIAKAQLELEASGARRPRAPQLAAPRASGPKPLTSASSVLSRLPVAAHAACRPMRDGPK